MDRLIFKGASGPSEVPGRYGMGRKEKAKSVHITFHLHNNGKNHV